MIRKVKNIIFSFYFSVDKFLARNTLRIYRYLCNVKYFILNNKPSNKEVDYGNKLRKFGVLKYSDSKTILNASKAKKLFFSEFYSKQNFDPKFPLKEIIDDGLFYEKTKWLITPFLDNVIKSYFKSDYQVYSVSLLLSSKETNWELDSSWLWHQDGYLSGSHLKLFFYLNDVTNNNGAFQFHNSVDSKRYIKKGFKVSYPERKYNKKQFIEKLDQSFNSIEGKKGTMFLCNVNSIIHRANMPKVGQREAIVFEVSPCLKKRNHLKLIDRDIYRSIFSRLKDSAKFVKNNF